MNRTPAASETQQTEHPATRAVSATLAPWFFIAVAPVFFAALTWNTGPADQFMAAIRLFGFPVAVVELGVIAIAVVRGWRPLRQIRSLSPSAPPLLALLILVACYAAIFSAPRPTGALIWTYLSFVHLSFGLSVAHLVSKAPAFDRRYIWPAVVVGTCTYALMLSVFANQVHRRGFDWQYLGLAVSNVRQVGYYAAVGGSAALACAVQSRGWRSAGFGAAAALVLAMLLWSGSRGALIAVVVAVAGMVMLMPAFRTVRSFLILASVGVASIPLSRVQQSPFSLYGLDRIVGSFELHRGEDISSGRLAVWRGAWQAILKRPLFGYGEGQFGFVVPQPQGIYLHPHNVLLQLLFQWGISGTVISLLLMILLFRRCLGKFYADPLTTVPALMVSIALAVMSLFDGALFHTYPLMMFSLSVALIAAAKASNDFHEVSDTGARQSVEVET